jgi:hypothetical protein
MDAAKTTAGKEGSGQGRNEAREEERKRVRKKGSMQGRKEAREEERSM